MVKVPRRGTKISGYANILWCLPPCSFIEVAFTNKQYNVNLYICFQILTLYAKAKYLGVSILLSIFNELIIQLFGGFR